MKQPFILTLMSTVACTATATNKAPENTTPTKSKTPTSYLSMLMISVMAIWNVTELKTCKPLMSTGWQNPEFFSPTLMQQPPPVPLPAIPC